MLMFNLAISCLTTCNLPWFMDLTFQVPMHYCSSQHWTLLLSPVTSTAECCLCLDSSSSFFLELLLHWSPVAYWAPTDLGSSCFSVLSFCLFILLMGFSRQEYTEELDKNDLHDPDNHNGVITHLEPDILECEVKWALGSITMYKASGGDGIPVELFQILKYDAVKVLNLICQQIWKTQQWPQDCFNSNPQERQCQTMFKLSHNCIHLIC